MKKNKLLFLILTIALSLSLMGCPTVTNRGPQFVKLVDDEIVSVNEVTYYHVRGTDFHPEDMIQDLIETQGLMAIDYDQSKIAIGKTRDYDDISDQIFVTSFYQIWLEGEDANFDGVVDEKDEEYYGQIKTDIDGNRVYDNAKIALVEYLSVGKEINFTMRVTDSEGAKAEVSGKIVVIS